jgi:hypothetical protein
MCGLLRRAAAAKVQCRNGSNGKQRWRGAMLTGNGTAGIRRPSSLEHRWGFGEAKYDRRGGAPGFNEWRTWLKHGGGAKRAEARSRDDGGRWQPGILRRQSMECMIGDAIHGYGF